MLTLALLTAAALVFSVLAGVLDGMRSRRVERRLQRKEWPALHPLTQHEFRRPRPRIGGRVLRHAALFLGFLVASYVGLLVLKAARHVLADWLSLGS